MKWFFALNQMCPTYEHYADMIKVAVHTARKRTALVPHIIFDGEENDLTRWLRQRDVHIIFRRSFLYQDLKAIAEADNAPHVLTIGAGAFLRTELPAIAAEMGFSGETVLYTDCDVMFMRDVVAALENKECRYFAVAPEFKPRNYTRMNTGVMLMNLKNLAVVDIEFREFMRRHLHQLTKSTWDQRAYQLFYDGAAGVRDFFHHRTWNRLPPEMNWKPYWGDNADAQIIHFHGPKPFQREYLAASRPRFKRLSRTLHRWEKGAFSSLCVAWDKELAEAS